MNDRRVIVISQFLVAACAGRSAEDLAEVLSSALTNLDLAAIQLLEARSAEIRGPASHTEKQPAFFERPKPAKRKRLTH